MLTNQKVLDILGQEFVSYANNCLSDANYNDFTKGWVLDFIATREAMLSNKVGDYSTIPDPNEALQKIIQNLSADINTELPCSTWEKVKYRFLTQAIYHVTEFGEGYVYVQDKLKPIERIRCAIKSDMPYPMSSERYSYIMRHEISHCMNSDYEVIKNVNQYLKAVSKVCDLNNIKDKRQFEEDIKAIKAGKPYKIAHIGFESNGLPHQLLKINMADLEEGVAELEQRLVLDTLSIKHNPFNDYALNYFTAKHIAGVVGLENLFKCRYEHNYNELSKIYKSRTEVDLTEILKKLNSINDRVPIDITSIANIKSDYQKELYRIECAYIKKQRIKEERQKAQAERNAEFYANENV